MIVEHAEPMPVATPIVPTSRRQLSPVRVLVAMVLVATAVVGGVAMVRRAARARVTLPAPWFAPYVDATLTPPYPFEDAAAAPAAQVVLGFVVAAQGSPCEPSWGGAYGLAAASTSLDLDRRLQRLHEHGADAVVSFGGAANRELATVCSDAAALADAYRAVVERYDVDAIDVDVEGGALGDAASDARRAGALAALQRYRSATGHPLAIWLTLPVDADGLPAAAVATLQATLQGGVDVAGVNAMTMNYGTGQARLRANIERSLDRLHGQLDAAYRAANRKFTAAELWRRIGATPLVGLADTAGEQFDLATATWLVDLAQRRGIGRLSMWSLNRDAPCAGNIDATKPSPYCSGLDQRPRAFAEALSAIGRAARAVESSSPSTSAAPVSAPARAVVDDDPAKSPYPIWRADRSYRQGQKVVWHGNVFTAKWFTHGDTPDAAGTGETPVPWRLIGPVLPGEHPPATTTIAPGTFGAWDAQATYVKGDRVQLGGAGYEAKWWTRGDAPGVDVANDWETPWQALGDGDARATAATTAATTGASATRASTATTAATTPTTTAAPATTTTATAAATTAAPATNAPGATTAAVAAVTGGATANCTPLSLEPLRFDEGSWELRPDVRRALDAAAPTIASGPYRSVTVVGRSDSRPSHSIGNDELSRRRADAVAGYLRANGVTVPIATDARSDRDPRAAGSLDANRTVELAAACG